METKLSAADFNSYTKKGIIMMFDELTEEHWEGFFKHASRTGLNKSKEEGCNKYNPFLVGDWLVRRGHYSRTNMDVRLFNSVPTRSLHKRMDIQRELNNKAKTNNEKTNNEERIMKELIAIQSELKAPKGQFNKFGNYSYRSCEDILEAVKPLLTKYNATILITDEVKGIGDHIYIEANIEFRVGDKCVQVKAQAGINPNRKGMDVAQSYGASSSYARKYALAGLLLLDDNKDADTKDNSEENKPSTKKDLDDVKKVLKEAHENGTLKQVYFELSSIQQTELRDFANELKRTS